MTVLTLAQTSDFSAIADCYDATREIPPAALNTCYDRPIGAELLPRRGTIPGAGCGTGQISLPLAEQGFRVRGFDISPAMAAVAQTKCLPDWDARYVAADVRALPVPDATFDAIVVSKLFQHIQNWQRACIELLRVLRRGGLFVEVRDRGTSGNAVRRHFAARADALGHGQRYVGLAPRDRTPRLFAEFWYLPDDVHDRILAETAAWPDEEPGGSAQLEVMTPHLSLEVFRKT
jgi:SAM-dependent methyltransferase